MQFQSFFPLKSEDLNTIRVRIMTALDHTIGPLKRDSMVISFGQHKNKTFRAAAKDTNEIRGYVTWCRNRGCRTVVAWQCRYHQVHQFIKYIENYLELYDNLVTAQATHNVAEQDESDVEIVSLDGVSQSEEAPMRLSDADLDKLADRLADKLTLRLKR